MRLFVKSKCIPFLPIAILYVMIISGCQPNDLVKTPTLVSPVPLQSPTVLRSPLDAQVTPTSVKAQPVVVPTTVSTEQLTPSPGKGIVTGRFIADNDNSPFVIDGNVYLGKLIKSNNPSAAPILGLTRGTDPKASVDISTGSFVFTDVVPGTYALIIDGVLRSYAVANPGGGFLLVEVQADKVTDMGNVHAR